MVTEQNILQGEHLRLTAVREEDVEAIGREQEDAGFWRLLSTSPSHPRTKEANTKYVQELSERKDAFAFVIRPVAGEGFIGMISLERIDWSNGGAELGMGIDREYWGQGHGTESLDLLLRFAFHELNLHRVALGVFEYNTRAIALYERAGFVREGTDREYINRDGRRYDLHRYGMLRHEWEARRTAAT